MKLSSFLHTVLPPVMQKDDLQEQRERILFNILLVMSVLGFGLLIINSRISIQEQRWITLGIFGLIYLWTLSATFFRRLPYSIRSISLVLIIYILGTVSLIQDGLPGNGRIYLITFSVITGVLMGAKTSILAILLSSTSLAIFNFFMFRSITALPLSDPVMGEKFSSAFLIQSTFAFLAVSIITTVSLVTLLKVLEKSLKKEKESAANLQEERQQLAVFVEERTSDLERRLVQIRTAAEITRSISSMLDPDELLQQVVDLVKERFDLYYAGVFLNDETSTYAVLRAGTGEAGKKMIMDGHRLAIGGSSMIGWTTSNKKPRIALDVGLEAVRFSNPHLPLTRSELALPLVIGDQSLGALTVQSSKPEAFDEDDITVLQGISDSLATALENAKLYHQTQKSLDEIRKLHQQYLVKAWSEVDLPESSLSYTFENDKATGAGETANLIVPLMLRDQEIGQVHFEGNRTELTPEEKIYVDVITTEAAVALENVRLLQETQRRAERERLVSHVSSKVRASMDVDTVLETTIREVGRILRASSGYIQLDLGQSTAINKARDGDQENPSNQQNRTGPVSSSI